MVILLDLHEHPIHHDDVHWWVRLDFQTNDPIMHQLLRDVDPGMTRDERFGKVKCCLADYLKINSKDLELV